MEAEDWKKYIPIGFRFCPTDYELFIYYLRAKMYSEFIFPGIIHDVDVYQYDPYHLPGMDFKEQYSYYFTPRDKKYPNGSRPSRCIKDGRGTWKITGKPTVFKNQDGTPLGKENTLVFYRKNITEAGRLELRKTNWIMHEYVLDQYMCPSKDSATTSNKLNDVVLCRIYLHEPAEKRKEMEMEKEWQLSQTCSIQWKEPQPKKFRPSIIREPEPSFRAAEAQLPSFTPDEIKWLQGIFGLGSLGHNQRPAGAGC
ncbi:hypothetical protein F0562_009651 [Nyssa sinensis]|uniref:NAC domain-containing protein n=1 Tax=Nyssa sinensis TaxID=561372 RepID=A0A5J4ZYV9_9ASTE|nr:hypothetical protein F0562_009651 [Nyssa sinensis]